MPINMWRLTDVDPDNHNTNQCLQCRKIFTGYCASEGWKFCPLCGTKWEGQQRQDPAQVRIDTEVLQRQWPPRHDYWVIEGKHNGHGGYWSEWHKFQPFAPIPEVYERLKQLRRSYEGEMEFKARKVKV